MNPNAKKWVEALRSGEYKQTKQFLHDPVGFCCLGVACDLYIKQVGGGWERRTDTAALSFDGQSDALPTRVRVWLGLEDESGSYWVDDEIPTDLALQNDSGASFAEIADIIESEPEGLFDEAKS